MITVAVQSKAWIVFTYLNVEIMGLNLTQGMDVCVCLFCVCVGTGLVIGWSLVQGVLPIVLGLRNWSETKRFTDALCFKVGATGKRERDNTVIIFWPLFIILFFVKKNQDDSVWKVNNCINIPSTNFRSCLQTIFNKSDSQLVDISKRYGSDYSSILKSECVDLT
jgi:hypothetical protein